MKEAKNVFYLQKHSLERIWRLQSFCLFTFFLCPLFWSGSTAKLFLWTKRLSLLRIMDFYTVTEFTKLYAPYTEQYSTGKTISPA